MRLLLFLVGGIFMKSGMRLKRANHTWKCCVKRALQGISDYLCQCDLISDSCVRQPTCWTSKHVHSVICLCVCSVWHGDDSGSGYRVRDDGHVWRSCWHWAWCLFAHSHSGREVFTSASTLVYILYTFLLKGLLFFLGMWYIGEQISMVKHEMTFINFALI